MRSTDWASTPLGPVESWSPALRSTVALLLHNHWGMLLWWGPKFVQLYNDAYRPVLGAKHPRALGQPVSECWSEIWHIIGPMIERPFRGGPASTSDDLMLPLRRKAFLEEAHFRVAYSPVPDDSVPGTGIGGVLATVTETTEQVYGERQLRTLRELGEKSSTKATTAERACSAAAETLQDNPWDVPFALFYLISDDGKSARLVADAGFAQRPGSRVAPPLLELVADDAQACAWPLARAASEKTCLVVEDLAAHGSELPVSPWSTAPSSAIVLPLTAPEQANAYGVLVCGISPHRALDSGYRAFFEIAASQIVNALRNARALEEQCKRAEALAEIDRAKTAFFSNVSHEFRTPLSLMLGPTEDLLAHAHGPLSATQRQQLELVHRSEMRLHKLVNSLLDFARIEAGRIEACYEPVDLGALTRDLASAFRAAFERAALSFEVDCPSLSVPTYVDRDMWEKIVLNLLSNAFKFTFEGRVVIELREAADRVELCVTDTGTGVPEHELPRLFERFHRIAGTRSRTHEGSGIGLALVHELVKLHGGTVSVESRLGAGTAFHVCIPAGSAHLPQDRIQAPKSLTSSTTRVDAFIEEALRWLPEGSEPRASGEPSMAGDAAEQASALPVERILLADDNSDMRDYVRRILERHWIVEAVEDGEKALAAARARQPHLVVTDVMMPGLDGFGLLHALRADPSTKAIPVIMLSARAGEESRLEGLAAGADDYLVKPFSARELAARVRLHLENARLRRAAEERLVDVERALRFSEVFVGVLGHDLRNPLSAVAAAANLLAEPTLGAERAPKLAKRILANTTRMERMISPLLDFTSIRLGRGLPLKLVAMDLAAECRAALEELRPVYGVEVAFEAVGDCRGSWDRDRMLQLLSNLIGNAHQHGGAGNPPRVRVDGAASSSRVALEIRNHGAIPSELLPNIFEPLRQGKSNSKKRDGSTGLGLGLYISQQIVQAHRGTIRVESNETDG
ncbi:MAG TPA: ATP-binding protein, partial [Polyangiales bacterium]|nr:ATP-binding protein [Polyangiales bacterium]